MSGKNLLVFKVTGTNEYAADTGILTLFVGDREVMRSTAFSGGRKSQAQSDPLPSGTYRIRTDIRNIYRKYTGDNGENENHIRTSYGIEKIEEVGWFSEWGHLRARLNEPSPGLPQAYRGNYLHGKVRVGDYTHGCICERSERILNYLWNMAPGRVDVRVER